MSNVLTIRFTNGNEESFEFEPRDQPRAGSVLQEFLKHPTVALQLDDELIVIPETSIERISIKGSRGVDRGPVAGVIPVKRRS